MMANTKTTGKSAIQSKSAKKEVRPKKLKPKEMQQLFNKLMDMWSWYEKKRRPEITKRGVKVFDIVHEYGGEQTNMHLFASYHFSHRLGDYIELSVSLTDKQTVAWAGQYQTKPTYVGKIWLEGLWEEVLLTADYA